MSISLLTRGYIQEVRPVPLDICVSTIVKAQDDGIKVSTADLPVSIATTQDSGIKVNQPDDSTRVLPSDTGTIIKIDPC
jgi:hypothetical protein